MRRLHTSKTIWNDTDFDDANDVIEHLRSTYTDGMTDANHGRGSDKWHIGHRIAVSMYDPKNDEDTWRCYSRANLFAQWETDNLKATQKLPPSDELKTLARVWPVAWKNKLPSEDYRLVLEKRARGR